MKIKHVINKFFLIFIFLFSLLSCKAQNEIALQFVENEKGYCELSTYRDGKNKKSISYISEKREFKDKIVFKICSQYFIYDKSKKHILKNLPAKILLGSINEMMEKQETAEFRYKKSETYSRIYIIEETSNSQKKVYPVIWDSSHKYEWEDVQLNTK